jgi:hypothetical protein
MKLGSIALVAFCVALPWAAQTDIDILVTRVSEGALDVGALWQLEAQPTDPRILPALRKAFDERAARRDRQELAATLSRLGEKDDRYFDCLAGYAKEAIEDRIPFFEKFDQEGRSISGQFSAEFENWCARNNKNPIEVAARQFQLYPEDVKILAEVEDSRAIELFRRGLDSNNPGVIAYSAQGLGRLHDLTALPLISKAANRIPAGERAVIASQLPWYSHPDAERLLEQLVPDSYRRDYLRRNVQILRVETLKRAQGRRGLAVQK